MWCFPRKKLPLHDFRSVPQELKDSLPPSLNEKTVTNSEPESATTKLAKPALDQTWRCHLKVWLAMPTKKGLLTTSSELLSRVSAPPKSKAACSEKSSARRPAEFIVLASKTKLFLSNFAFCFNGKCSLFSMSIVPGSSMQSAHITF